MPPFGDVWYDLAKVSIRTRHCCRVMHGKILRFVGENGFNPHPALLPGDAHDHHRATANTVVSIRTRHCCRVMRKGGRYALLSPPFQSAPGIAAG